MPWQGSAPNKSFQRSDGTRTGSQTWQEADAAGVDIISPDHDTHDQDIADGLNQALLRDGGNTAVANIPMGGFRHTNLGDASALTQATTIKQFINTVGQYCTVAGSANAVTLTTGFSITAYATGQTFSFKVGTTNTGPATVNVDGRGVKSVVRADGSNTALAAGDLRADSIVEIQYDGTQFQLRSPSATGVSSDVLARMVRAGSLVVWPSATVPGGWLDCFGQAVLRATYPELDVNLYVGDSLNATAAFGYRATSSVSPSSNRSTSGQYIVLPDLKNRTVFGQDDTSNPANRITTAVAGFDGDTLGAAGGAQSVPLAQANLPNATLSGTTGGSGSHFHYTVADADSENLVTLTGSNFVALTGYSGSGNSNNYLLRGDPSTPTLGRTSTDPNHTHAFVTSSMNGGVTQTEVNKMPPGIILKWIILANPAAASAGSLGVNGLQYSWNTATSGDPGTGGLLVNNATLASATALNISETDATSSGVGAYLATWDDSTSTVKGYIQIFRVGAPGTFVIYAVSGTLTDNGGYDTFTVTHIASNGTFSDGDGVSVLFHRAGDKGEQGDTGPSGLGDVVGPSSSVGDNLAAFDGTTGKLIKDSGISPAYLQRTTAQTYSYTPYDPTVSRSVVEDGTTGGQYNHCPAIAVFDSGIDVAWQGNESSGDESQPGQRIYMRHSTDDGVTWGAKHEPFNDGTYSNNPITPTNVQAEPHLIVFSGEEHVFWSQRGTSNQEACIWSKRASALDKWTNYRLLFDTTTNVPTWSDTDITGSPGAGYSLRYSLQGVDYQVVPSRPFIDSGTLVVPIVLIQHAGGYGSVHYVSTLFSEDGGATWFVGGIIPHGVVGAGEGWEPTLIKGPDGLYVMHVRDISGSENQRQAYSVSADLMSWAPLEFSDVNVHTIRPRAIPVSRNRSIMLLLAHATLRNAVSLAFSGDGQAYAVGYRVSDEMDGTHLVHYSDAAFDGDDLLVAYSQGPVPSGVRDIKFVRLEQTFQDDELIVSPSEKNAVENDDPDQISYVDDGKLIVNPRGVGAIETRGDIGYVTLRWRVTAAPSTHLYRIATIGNAVDYMEVRLIDDGGTARLQVDGVTVDTPIDCTEWQDLQISFDKVRGKVSAFGREWQVGPLQVLYVGDAWNLGAGDQTGNIEIDIAGCSLTTAPRIRNQLEVPWYQARTSDGHVVFGGTPSQIENSFYFTFRQTVGFRENPTIVKNGSAAVAALNVTRDAGQFAYVNFQTVGSARWFLGVNNEAESGANAGTNFILRARDDSGNNIGDAIVFNRATLDVTFGGHVNLAAGKGLRWNPNSVSITEASDGLRFAGASAYYGFDNRLGIFTNTPSHPLTVQDGSLAALIGADNAATTLTEAVQKTGRLAAPHYNLTEEPLGILNATSSNTANVVIFGGGSSLLNAATELRFHTAATRTTQNGTNRFTIDLNGNVAVGTAALAVDATNGFLYIPTCPGAPTGTPAAKTGLAPFMIDSTNNKLYFYSGGSWRDAGP